MDEKLLEQRFFTWSFWDQGDVAELFFHNVEFVTDFGVFKTGDKFASVFLSYKDRL